MLNIGDILDGRYQILSKIGQGGMATVYRARDLKLDREIAIKMLKEEYSTDKEFIERFKNEARAAARLSHSNIVAAYDIVNSGDMHYIVMELVEGITLRDYIARKGRLSNKETIGIAMQAAEGLGEAHRNGIIHRDIKSQNIIISKEGRIKIGDFGIAKRVSTDSSGQPVIGSAHYMAPEQAQSGEADARSDLYSLGISMYEMITGRLPYQGEDAGNVIMAHMQDAMVPPVVYNSGIYPALNDIILKATKKAPEDRYQSAEELIEDLKHAAAEPDGHFVKLYDSVSSSEYSRNEGGASQHAAAEQGSEDAHKEVSGGAASGAYDNDNAKASSGRGQNVPVDAYGVREHGTGSEYGNGNKDIVDDFLDDDDEDYVVERNAHRGSKGGILDSYEDSKTKFMIAGITAAIVIIVFIIGGFVLKSGSDAHKAAESKIAESETESSSDSQTESSGSNDYTVSITGEDVMPDLIGMNVDDARAKLASIHMSMDSSTTDYSDKYAKGTVMNQSPAANEVLNSDSTVYVTVSLGNKEDYILDNLKNMTKDAAVKAVQDAGMAVSDECDRDFSDEVAEDLVLSYKDDGKTDDGKRRVKLVLSYGKEEDYIKMPDVTNMALEDAFNTLDDNNLSIGKITAVSSSDSEEGDVVTQSVKSDDMIKKGRSVDLEVCVGSGSGIKSGTIFKDINEFRNALNGTVVSPGSGSSYDSGEYYYGNIDTVCTIGDTAAGPGAQNSVLVGIRLAQRVDGSIEYTSLSEPIPVSEGTKIPVSFRNIKGAYGVTEGTVEVYAADTGNVYSSYVIRFSQHK